MVQFGEIFLMVQPFNIIVMINLTDRELLEQIYLLLLQIYNKVKEIDNDEKQFNMNVLANLVGDSLIDIKKCN